MWSFGSEECSIPWLLVLPSRIVVRKRLVLDQIPILWKVKYSGEREEMDSHLENFWSFYLSSLFFFNSLERRYGSCLLFLFLSSGASLSIFLEDDPYSMRIELLEGSVACIDHSRWIGSLWRFLVLL